METGDDYFLRYMHGGLHQVEGWAQPAVFPVLRLIDEYQQAEKLAGDVAEIGVHHGKFFIGLHNCLAEGELSLAIDIFDDQRLNVDRSGSANLQRFLDNLAQHAFEPERCLRIAGDSLDVRLQDVAAACQRPVRTRIFSVDGGHTPEHTINDIQLAISLSHAHGVIFVDDYYNPHWPGVHIGVNRLYDSSYPSFVPFGYVRDKLMLTSLSWQKTFFDLLVNRYSGEPHFKAVTMFGHRVAVV